MLVYQRVIHSEQLVHFGIHLDYPNRSYVPIVPIIPGERTASVNFGLWRRFKYPHLGIK
jgi:hypothetical protein